MQTKTMIRAGIILVALAAASSGAFSQLRDYRVHSRSLLHQTEYNTGEIGRAYSASGTVQPGFPCLEWPPNSTMILDRVNYPGQHNSFGSGIYVAATTAASGRLYSYDGAVTESNGENPLPIEGVYSSPVSIDRVENYPVLADGSLNLAYNPNEAEEIITARWDCLASPSATSTIPLGIRVTRTSRAWSIPGYDSFIIYEYEFDNTSSDTLRDVSIVFLNSFAPSMFGYQRKNGPTWNWNEVDYRGQPPDGAGNQFARLDTKRWMTYNHDREGNPDSVYFDSWSTPGNRGGLNSPQAVGLVMLYYDYAHLATKSQTRQVWISPSDTAGAWDENNKLKQPFLLRYENGNLPTTKTQAWMNTALQRKTGIAQGTTDSVRFFDTYNSANPYYWLGRTKGSVNLSWWQPVVHAYGFHPYILPPGQSLRFAVAEVAGYGPGVAGDRIYHDLGGTNRDGVDVAGMHFTPVPSWYDTLQYPYVGTPPYIGSRYLQTHPLPWYVTPGVVSIRDVADRAIQMYTGQPLVKHDSLQYEPLASPSSGRYNTVPIPPPSPSITVENTRAALNRIVWGPQVEKFDSLMAGGHPGRERAPLRYYEALRAPSPLGPWALMDSVGLRDPRYFRPGDSGTDSSYVVYDTLSYIGSYYYYAVRSVDALGGRSGWTNISEHLTKAPPQPSLSKVYVVPNPLIVTYRPRSVEETDPTGEVTDRLQFYGLTAHCTIRIFSYSGQLVQTLRHDDPANTNPWFQISRNNQMIASGVYFFVVEDDNGTQAHGKFVIIH